VALAIHSAFQLANTTTNHQFQSKLGHEMTATSAVVTINKIHVFDSSATTTDEPGESAEWALTFIVNGQAQRWFHDEVRDDTSYALHKVFPDVPLGTNQTLTISVSGIEEDDSSADDPLPTLEKTLHPAQDFELGGTFWITSPQTPEGFYKIEVTVQPAQDDGQAVTAAREYHGVYRSGSGGHAMWHGEWKNFEAKWKEFSAQGLRLKRVSVFSKETGVTTFGDSTIPTFLGIFESGTDGHALMVSEWPQFEEHWKRSTEKGLRLVDVATYTHDGKQFFVGVYRAGTDGHALWALDRPSFFKKWEELSKTGLRLVALDTFGAGAKRMFIGAFRGGADGHAFVPDVAWRSFSSKWKEFSKSGLRLIDLIAYYENGKAHYCGVFRAGGDRYVLTPRMTWIDFTKDWDARTKDGLRLVSVESISTGDRS